MMKISDLQSQIALNRRNLAFFEEGQRDIINYIKYLKYEFITYEGDDKEQWVKNMQSVLNNRYKDLAKGKKWIAKYAKLQRALKSELAYRIQCNRMTREVEAMTQKAKEEGWEVLIFDDNIYNQMLKGE